MVLAGPKLRKQGAHTISMITLSTLPHFVPHLWTQVGFFYMTVFWVLFAEYLEWYKQNATKKLF